jgi:hypothetical protein
VIPALLAALAAGVGAASPYRFTRSIEAPPGWVSLELPDDVLDSCRPGLPDLRVVDGAGREIAFAFASEREAPPRRLELRDVESQKGIETTAIVDRGLSPGFADAVTFEIDGPDEFIKPVRIESSEDAAAWRDVAGGSIFATSGGARRTTLPIPETDRRYLRFRFDDRNGDPVRPSAVLLRPASGETRPEAADRPLQLSPLASAEHPRVSRYAATLPAANLAFEALRFEASDPAFARRVRVSERILFRDEVCRCLIAEGVVSRSPAGVSASDLPVSGASARLLEIEIENQDSPPLQALRVTARTRPVRLRFFAPDVGHLSLLYGSAAARRPAYDLPRALTGSSAGQFRSASLGPATEAAAPRAETTPPRASLSDAAKWTSRRRITLPASGSVAYLDFYGSADPARLRIADSEGRQVPFLSERGSHEHSVAASFTTAQRDGRTEVRIDLPGHAESVAGLDLSASGPDYFRRGVAVSAERRDRRGPTDRTPLGGATWERRPGEPPSALRVSVAPPGPDAVALLVEIENGDNVPLTISVASLRVTAARIDFPFRPGETLFLLSGNPEAAPPRYDLELLADSVLGAPAEAAGLEASQPAAPARPARPAWLIAVVAAAAAALLFQLSRTLRAA